MRRLRRVHGSLLLATALACSGGGGDVDPPPGACPQVGALDAVSTVAAQNRTGVSAGTSVTMRFNTCLDLQTVRATNVALRSSNITRREVRVLLRAATTAPGPARSRRVR